MARTDQYSLRRQPLHDGRWQGSDDLACRLSTHRACLRNPWGPVQIETSICKISATGN